VAVRLGEGMTGGARGRGEREKLGGGKGRLGRLGPKGEGGAVGPARTAHGGGGKGGGGAVGPASWADAKGEGAAGPKWGRGRKRKGFSFFSKSR
jgi:hypothetical protein